MDGFNADLVLRNELIVENILSHISSSDLLEARFINDTFNWLGRKEIQKRGDHVIHFANDDEMNQFVEFLEKDYPDLDQWSPYSFKIPIGDIDRNVHDKFVALIGSRIKILDLYETYNHVLARNPQVQDTTVYPDEYTRRYSRDCAYMKTYDDGEDGVPFLGDYAEFIIASRTFPKIWHLLKHASASLLELSLFLGTELILISGRFPEQLPFFDRLKKLNLKYGENLYREFYLNLDENESNLDWDDVWGEHKDDKLFKNIVERAKNITNGHIITPYHGHSRILTEIGSIKFANGGKPSLETTVNFSSLQTPIIRNLMQQEFLNRVNVLEVRLQNVINSLQRASTNDFKELLHTLHDFIVSQSQSLRILSIAIKYESIYPNPVYPTNFTATRPLQPFSKLEVLELKPNCGDKYKLLKEFCKGDYPVLKEFYPFYDIDDVTYIEAPNVTMPQELLEKIRKSFDRDVKKRRVD